MLHYDTQQTRSTREDTSLDPSHGLVDILIHLSHQTLTLQLPATGDSYFDNCMICLDWEHSTSFFKTGPVTSQCPETQSSEMVKSVTVSRA